MILRESSNIRPERSMCVIKEKIYFLDSHNCRNLYRMNKDCNCIEIIAYLPIDISRPESFFLRQKNDVIYLFPEYGGYIYTYNLVTKKVRKGAYLPVLQQDYMYLQTVSKRDFLYLISTKHDVIRFCFDDDSVHVFDSSDKNQTLLCTGHQWGNLVLFVTCVDERVYSFDLDKQETNQLDVLLPKVSIMDVAFDGLSMFFLTNQGDIYKKKEHSNCAQLEFKYEQLIDNPFFGVVSYKRFLFLIPFNENYLFVVNDKGSVVKKMCLEDAHDQDGYICSEYYINNNYLYLLPREGRWMFLIDMKELKIKRIDMCKGKNKDLECFIRGL